METVESIIKEMEWSCDFFEATDDTLCCRGRISDPDDKSIIPLVEKALTERFGGVWEISQDWDGFHEVVGADLTTAFDDESKTDMSLEDFRKAEARRSIKSFKWQIERKEKEIANLVLRIQACKEEIHSMEKSIKEHEEEL